jgi:hypothetical protein
MDEDRFYYAARAAEERDLALHSERKNVREIHEELARLYDALVEQKELRKPIRSASLEPVG